ncbi:MAG: protein translocase subunit SecF, partial [Myxococcota bacterium]
MNWIKNKLDNLQIDFVRPRWIFAFISGVLVLASWFLFFLSGPLLGGPAPVWGIDFEGGTEIHLKFNAEKEVVRGIETGVINQLEGDPVEVDEIRDALKEMGLDDAVVQRVGVPEDQEYQIRIKDTTAGSEPLQDEVMEILRAKYGADALGVATAQAEVGTRMEIPFTSGSPPSVPEVTELLKGIDGATVAESKEVDQISVRLPGVAERLLKELADDFDAPIVTLATDSVGPKVGGDLANQGLIAIVITLCLVLVYIAFRFDIGFAPGAVLALLHDVSLTAGVFVLIGLEINLAIVGALLTIVGYSLNDTVVVFDRVRENLRKYKTKELKDVLNISINETLSRTFMTSVTTLLALIALFVLGGDVIRGFVFAMIWGVIVG